MADICADGPARFEVGLLSKQTEAWVLDHPGPRGPLAQGLLLLHARAHRRHALRAHRAGVDPAHVQARLGAAGDDDRPVPPGRAGLPRRGRAGRHPVHQRRRLRGLQGARRHRAPPRPQGHAARSGPGAGAWPSASASRTAATTTAHFIATGDGAFPLVLDHESLKPENLDPEVVGPVRRRRRRAGATRSSPSAGPWPSSSPSSAERRPSPPWSWRTRSAAGAWCGPSTTGPLPPGTLDHLLELATARARRPASARAGRSSCSKGPSRPAATGTSPCPLERRAGVPLARAAGARRR